MSAADQIRADLKYVEAEAARLTDADLVQYPALRLSRISLARRIEQLRDELLVAERGEARVRVTGGAVRNNAVEVGFLQRWLELVQKGVAETYRKLAPPRADGTMPSRGDASVATELMFAGSFAGSFGMRLIGKNVLEPLEAPVTPVVVAEAQAVAEAPAAPAAPASPAARALTAFVSAMAVGDLGVAPAVAIESRARLERIGPRAWKHLRSLGELCREHDATVDVELDVPVIGAFAGRMTPVGGSLVSRLIKQANRETTERVVEGRLTGGNIRRGRFEVVSDDGEVFEGSVPADLRLSVEALFGKRVRARLRVRVAILTLGNRRRHRYRLLELEPA